MQIFIYDIQLLLLAVQSLPPGEGELVTVIP